MKGATEEETRCFMGRHLDASSAGQAATAVHTKLRPESRKYSPPQLTDFLKPFGGTFGPPFPSPQQGPERTCGGRAGCYERESTHFAGDTLSTRGGFLRFAPGIPIRWPRGNRCPRAGATRGRRGDASLTPAVLQSRIHVNLDSRQQYHFRVTRQFQKYRL